MYIAYCELAGLPSQRSGPRISGQKWIAEDVFFHDRPAVTLEARSEVSILASASRAAQRNLRYLSAQDPLPLLRVSGDTFFIPALFGCGLKALWSDSKGDCLAISPRRSGLMRGSQDQHS